MKDTIGQAMNWKELVDYGKAAIVSREVIRRDKGTVTMFAFDKGQGLSEHTAPFDALIFVVDGKAVVTICGKPQTVKLGEMVIMPAHKPHSVQAKERFKMVLVMIRA